jgi:RNA 2',3'-cyclic 3'-phosphodiesterase
MRLFVGVELPEDVRRAAASAAEQVGARIAVESPSAALRWVEPANLHVTICFLGDVPDWHVKTLAPALEVPLAVPVFTLRVAGAGVFPESRSPRAVWLGLPSGRDGLLAVHDRVSRRLISLGFEPEKRPYSPHLTIARVKDIRRADVPALRRILREADVDAGTCQVRNATLFRSLLSSTGPRYSSVLRLPLQ